MPVLGDATALYVGDTPAKRVFLGDTLVWEPPTAVETPPPMLVPGLRLWLDATTTEEGYVAEWTDRSGSGLSAVQSLAAKQPISMPASDGSGGATVDFVSNRDTWMDIDGLGTLLEGLSEHTIILRFYPRTYGQYPIFMTGPSTSVWTWLLELNSPIGWYWGSGGNQKYRRYDQVPTMNQWWVVSHVFGSTSKTFFNGVETPHSGLGTNGDIGAPAGIGPTVRLGSYFDESLEWDGHISDILIYDRALTDAERQQIEGYIGIGRPYWSPGEIPQLDAWIDDTCFSDGPVPSLMERSRHHRVFTSGANAPMASSGVLTFDQALQHALRTDGYTPGPNGITFVTVAAYSPGMAQYGQHWSYGAQLEGSVNASNEYEMRYEGNHIQLVGDYSRGGPVFGSTQGLTADRFYVHWGEFSALPSQWCAVYINGVPAGSNGMVSSMSCPVSNLNLGNRIPDGYWFHGRIKEAMVFSGTLSSQDREKVVEYLMSKHGIEPL